VLQDMIQKLGSSARGRGGDGEDGLAAGGPGPLWEWRAGPRPQLWRADRTRREHLVPWGHQDATDDRAGLWGARPGFPQCWVGPGALRLGCVSGTPASRRPWRPWRWAGRTSHGDLGGRPQPHRPLPVPRRPPEEEVQVPPAQDVVPKEQRRAGRVSHGAVTEAVDLHWPRTGL
jgi:hypothetical protein